MKDDDSTSLLLCHVVSPRTRKSRLLHVLLLRQTGYGNLRPAIHVQRGILSAANDPMIDHVHIERLLSTDDDGAE